MVGKKVKRFLYHTLLPRAGLKIVKSLSLTYRFAIVDPEKERRALDRYGSLIYASWHQRFFPGITFFSTRKPIAIMISQSRDGELIARVVKILGWHPVRGSSTRGGDRALDELKHLAQNGYKIGHIIDGPKGPFGEVKPGLLKIAQAAGIPIVPTLTSAQNKWQFNSWDRFIIPKPFSRVIIRFGDGITVPRELDGADFEAKRRFIKDQMAALYEETDRIWEDPVKTDAVFNRRTLRNTREHA